MAAARSRDNKSGHPYDYASSEGTTAPKRSRSQTTQLCGPGSIPFYSLFVHGITTATTAIDLKRHFERCGTIETVNIPYDTANKKNKGYAFITYIHPHDASQAVRQLEGTKVNGNVISVAAAKSAPHIKDPLHLLPPGHSNSTPRFGSSGSSRYPDRSDQRKTLDANDLRRCHMPELLDRSNILPGHKNPRLDPPCHPNHSDRSDRKRPRLDHSGRPVQFHVPYAAPPPPPMPHPTAAAAMLRTPQPPPPPVAAAAAGSRHDLHSRHYRVQMPFLVRSGRRAPHSGSSSDRSRNLGHHSSIISRGSDQIKRKLRSEVHVAVATAADAADDDSLSRAPSPDTTAKAAAAAADATSRLAPAALTIKSRQQSGLTAATVTAAAAADVDDNQHQTAAVAVPLSNSPCSIGPESPQQQSQSPAIQCQQQQQQQQLDLEDGEVVSGFWVHISQMGFQTTDSDLRGFLGRAGVVTHAEVRPDKTGVGAYANAEEAENAVNLLSGAAVWNSIVTITHMDGTSVAGTSAGDQRQCSN